MNRSAESASNFASNPNAVFVFYSVLFCFNGKRVSTRIPRKSAIQKKSESCKKSKTIFGTQRSQVQILSLRLKKTIERWSFLIETIRCAACDLIASRTPVRAQRVLRAGGTRLAQRVLRAGGTRLAPTEPAGETAGSNPLIFSS